MKLPRDLSGWKVVNGLRRLGFTQDNQHGSHIRFTKGRLKVTIPNHKAILPKTLKSICDRLRSQLMNSCLLFRPS
ncbi:MAG: hypothetical protein DME74_07130 [Verrucomicrobia bacterium]|nr:MAG: hypothetical protein DME74_07130 [Verrucomicrobiota bacterium]